MKGKHKKWSVHTLSALNRAWLRLRIAGSVEWEPLIGPEPGCTAIIGVCSRLPDVLMANLRCLSASRWPDLKRVIAVVDCVESGFPAKIKEDTATAFPELKIEFAYYSSGQSALAESLKHPFVYSWLSWCIALKHTTTSHVLIHDYDALVLGSALQKRYNKFVDSGARVQGIAWYQGNGVEKEDHLATTFEAFMDTRWLRSLQPLDLYNKLRIIEGRSIDFDTTLDIQLRLLTPAERSISPMKPDELVHPSQMICQFTMFRRFPGAPLPCFSMPMIPFFYYLSGRTEAIERATLALQRMTREDVDLLGDGSHINLSMLDVAQVDWLLKQSVQACLGLSIAPDHRLYAYGQALYRVVDTPILDIWRGDFTAAQRDWIDAAAQGLL